MKAKFVLLVTIILGSVIFLAPGVDASHRVVIGEFENCQSYRKCRNMTASQRLDIDMYIGTLNGKSYWTRCEDMGGYIRTEYWTNGRHKVCRNVDR